MSYRPFYVGVEPCNKKRQRVFGEWLPHKDAFLKTTYGRMVIPYHPYPSLDLLITGRYASPPAAYRGNLETAYYSRFWSAEHGLGPLVPLQTFSGYRYQSRAEQRYALHMFAGDPTRDAALNAIRLHTRFDGASSDADRSLADAFRQLALFTRSLSEYWDRHKKTQAREGGREQLPGLITPFALVFCPSQGYLLLDHSICYMFCRPATAGGKPSQVLDDDMVRVEATPQQKTATLGLDSLDCEIAFYREHSTGAMPFSPEGNQRLMSLAIEAANEGQTDYTASEGLHSESSPSEDGAIFFAGTDLQTADEGLASSTDGLDSATEMDELDRLQMGIFWNFLPLDVRSAIREVMLTAHFQEKRHGRVLTQIKDGYYRTEVTRRFGTFPYVVVKATERAVVYGLTKLFWFTHFCGNSDYAAPRKEVKDRGGLIGRTRTISLPADLLDDFWLAQHKPVLDKNDEDKGCADVLAYMADRCSQALHDNFPPLGDFAAEVCKRLRL